MYRGQIVYVPYIYKRLGFGINRGERSFLSERKESQSFLRVSILRERLQLCKSEPEFVRNNVEESLSGCSI